MRHFYPRLCSPWPLVFALLLALPALSQDPRGSIGGRVVDASEAIVVGARVQATNIQTGVTAQARTNDSGTFLIPFLLPGMYRVSVEMPGFKTYSQDNVELRVADALDLTLHLELGDISQTVYVQAARPCLRPPPAHRVR